MSQFSCKYCGRPMAVSYLEYRSNSYCNTCFNDRAASKPIEKSRINTFEFMGDVIVLPKIKAKKHTS
jgi:hypothetical protein